ncbi:hypothetical protein GCM10010326_66210 [Streptomyces xanthochromogenes]|uniref:Uncharacterized protein n=1 Tax=Streptomyces xanthochromogenes TaxID=67384 RepID=A0ABQ3AMQ4_9ACTN|nr:hypothetical protein GCM10010326_66210 [Streptomyces xanthochromogenes]
MPVTTCAPTHCAKGRYRSRLRLAHFSFVAARLAQTGLRATAFALGLACAYPVAPGARANRWRRTWRDRLCSGYALISPRGSLRALDQRGQ